MTHPENEMLSGYAEILKHGLIADPEHWKVLKNGMPSSGMQDIIHHSLNIKSKIVLEDPFEKGLRKVLNFGHTLGHAVESQFLSGPDPLLHGEAIGIGMIMETYLSEKLTGLSSKEREEIIHSLLSIYGHHSIGKDQYEEIFLRTLQDKKNRDGQVQAVLLKNIGSPLEKTLDRADILEAIEFYDSLK